MHRLSLASLAIASLVLGSGCGGHVVTGSGAQSTGGSGGAGGATGTDTGCGAPAGTPGPYSLKMQFTVDSQQTVYLRQDCYLKYNITSCADDYTEPLAIRADCTVDCSSGDGCINCEPCAEGAAPVSPGAPQTDAWAGYDYTFDVNSSGCQCYIAAVAPAGKYRITIPVYANEQDALTNNNASYRVHDFTLPSPDGVAIFPVDLQ